MNPLEKRNEEQAQSSTTYNDQVKDSYLEVAVQAVVHGGEAATRHQDVDSCIVETIQELIGSWIGEELLPDMG